jgi:uncharacterized protein (DUF433 family)
MFVALILAVSVALTAVRPPRPAHRRPPALPAVLCVRGRTAVAPMPYDAAMDYSGIITIEPGKRSGKPCIRGLRITVYDVLDYMASGMTNEEILADFPDLTADDLRACLAFAADRERRLLGGPL